MLNKPSNFVPKGRVKDFSGTLSQPESAGLRFIVIPVSDEKKNTSGGSVFKRWPVCESAYNSWYRESYGNMPKWLGKIKTTQVQSDTVIVKALCMNADVIDYKALEKCIDALGTEAANNSGTVHMCKFGDWDKVSEMIDSLLLKRGLNVNIYEKF